jgi:hypothetical protein
MSGYVKRGTSILPKQGTKAPWVVRQSYIHDMLTLRFGRLRDGALKFTRSKQS